MSDQKETPLPYLTPTPMQPESNPPATHAHDDPIQINYDTWLTALRDLGINYDQVLRIDIVADVRGGRITLARARRDQDGHSRRGSEIVTTIAIESYAEMRHRTTAADPQAWCADSQPHHAHQDVIDGHVVNACPGIPHQTGGIVKGVAEWMRNEP